MQPACCRLLDSWKVCVLYTGSGCSSRMKLADCRVMTRKCNIMMYRFPCFEMEACGRALDQPPLRPAPFFAPEGALVYYYMMLAVSWILWVYSLRRLRGDSQFDRSVYSIQKGFHFFDKCPCCPCYNYYLLLYNVQ